MEPRPCGGFRQRARGRRPRRSAHARQGRPWNAFSARLPLAFWGPLPYGSVRLSSPGLQPDHGQRQEDHPLPRGIPLPVPLLRDRLPRARDPADPLAGNGSQGRSRPGIPDVSPVRPVRPALGILRRSLRQPAGPHDRVFRRRRRLLPHRPVDDALGHPVVACADRGLLLHLPPGRNGPHLPRGEEPGGRAGGLQRGRDRGPDRGPLSRRSHELAGGLDGGLRRHGGREPVVGLGASLRPHRRDPRDA